MDLATLAAGTFAPFVGAGFSLVPVEGTGYLPVTLETCGENPRGTMPGAPRTAFSLIFVRPVEGVPDFTGAYFFIDHDEIGRVGPVWGQRIFGKADQVALQVVFN